MPNQIKVDDLFVHIYQSEAQLARDAAKDVADYLHNLLKKKASATIVLATGNSQLQFLDALVDLKGIDWSRLSLFHLDEYLGIDANHPDSFRYYLRERVEKRVNPGKFHYIKGDALQPLAECRRYTKLLTAQPIDLCFLGIGENGHLAFNEPKVANFHDPDWIKLIKLDASTRHYQRAEGHFKRIEAVPQYAFTLTIPAICAAQKIVCLAPGDRKASIVKQMLNDPISSACPASILRQQANATLYLDQDSARLLP